MLGALSAIIVVVIIVIIIIGIVWFAASRKNKRNQPRTNTPHIPDAPVQQTMQHVATPVLASEPVMQASEPRIFLSYRRSDSADATGRIYDRLAAHYGRDAIFKDVDNIPFGVDFRQHITAEVGRCGVFLAVIGRTWTSVSDEQGRRLEDQTDFVRIEIEAALERNIPVVPLLVSGASMPVDEELPVSIRPLIYRNGTPIRPDPDFHKDMDRLIAGLDQMFT